MNPTQPALFVTSIVRAEQAHNGRGRPTTVQSTLTTRDALKGVVRPTKEADKATLRSTGHEHGRKSLEHKLAGTFYRAPRETTPT